MKARNYVRCRRRGKYLGEAKADIAAEISMSRTLRHDPSDLSSDDALENHAPAHEIPAIGGRETASYILETGECRIETGRPMRHDLVVTTPTIRATALARASPGE